MKNVLINAITIKEGGGLVVFTRTFNEMIQQDNTIHWIVVIDELLRDKINTNNHVTVLTFPWIKKSSLHLLFWNEIYLPKLIKKMNIDCIYSQINTLPFRKLRCKTFLSILHAGYFSKEFISLHFKYNTSLRQKIAWEIRKKWVFSSIEKADIVTAPTKALADEIISQLKIEKNKMAVILPGTGLAEGHCEPKHYPQNKTWRIGYITKYGVQKNFGVLLKAAANLKSKKIDFKLVLTLNKNHAPFQHIKSMIEKYNVGDVIENYGESSETKLRDLYSTLDLFVFPSLCESIGFTLIEAMYYGLPVIAANIPSNRELLGENGIFFQPYDFAALSEKIISVINSESDYLKLSNYSKTISNQLSWEKSARDTLAVLQG